MKICAFDVETRGKVPEFRSGAVWSDEHTAFDDDAAKFVATLRWYAERGYTFFAHNAEYDATIALWNRGQDLTVHYINSHFDCGYWKYGASDKRAQIWDTVRLSAGLDLATLGDELGVPKYPTPSALRGDDDWRQSWVCETHSKRECLECYNLRDAEIVWCYANMLREWLGDNQIKFHRSLPGIAVEFWRSWDRGQQQMLRSSQVRNLARSALHGGRCEVFKYGLSGPVEVFDVRSMHGAIMRDVDMPDCTKLEYASRGVQWKDICDSLGAVEATVYVEPQHIPPLPAILNERVYYPIGLFRGAWPIQELAEACANGAEVIRVHRAAWTNASVRPFAMFAPALLNLREEALRRGDHRELLYKFIINALPGRLGMRDAQVRRMYRRWRPGLRTQDLQGYELESSGNAVYMAREFEREVHSRSTNALWAATITGEARSRLNRHLALAGHSAIYCDTDSVHTMQSLPVGSGQPGSLVQKGYWDTGLYLGSKLYRLETHAGSVEVRAKGIPRSAADEYLRTGRTTYQTSLSIQDAIKSGRDAATWIDVDRAFGYQLGSRNINAPEWMRDRRSSSPTTPIVLTLDSDGQARYA